MNPIDDIGEVLVSSIDATDKFIAESKQRREEIVSALEQADQQLDDAAHTSDRLRAALRALKGDDKANTPMRPTERLSSENIR